jgi:hypothetical protein
MSHAPTSWDNRDALTPPDDPWEEEDERERSRVEAIELTYWAMMEIRKRKEALNNIPVPERITARVRLPETVTE